MTVPVLASSVLSEWGATMRAAVLLCLLLTAGLLALVLTAPTGVLAVSAFAAVVRAMPRARGRSGRS